MTPCGVTSLNPRDLIGRIYVGDHLTLPYIKYISCKSHGFWEDFLSFSHYKCLWPLDPRDMTSLDPRGLIDMIYVRGH